MLNQKYFAPLPAVYMVALLAILVAGSAYTQDAAQAAGISQIQGLGIVPGENSACSCGPNCQPNFKYWGHWPTVWRQWPQRRPDVTFPEALGYERLPAPEGVESEPLPKEEPYMSPMAPQGGGDFLPPVGEGPATGPGDPGMPFQLQPEFDPGSGFDQGVPGMENLPAQPPAPDTMPSEGTEDQGGGTPALTPPATPAEVPPATNTPPAPSVPAPNKGSADAIPDGSILTLRTRSAVGAKEAVAEEKPAARAANPITPQPGGNQPGETHSPDIQPAESEPAKPRPSGPQLVETQPASEGSLAADSVASEAVTARISKDDAAMGESLAEAKRPAPEPVRQTAYESPAEPWAVPKSWKSQRTHADNSTPGMADVHMEELQQPQPRQPAPEPGDVEMAEAPEPGGLRQDRGKAALVGLEGYCPVDLVRGEKWTLGDSQFAVEFEGRAYLMCGSEQHRAFRSNPKRYAPANAGNDPVLSYEENVLKAGRTESCAVFEGRLYMFESADTMARFQANPKRYTRALQETKN